MPKSDEVLRSLLRYDVACLSELEPTAPHYALTDQAEDALPLFQEAEQSSTSSIRLVGFDEAGRGALAGPVAVGCVSFAREDCNSPELLDLLAGLNDSKQVSPGNRERLYQTIFSRADASVGFASAHEVDSVGIVPACRLAALRALGKLASTHLIGMALFDRGLCLDPQEGAVALPSREITKGDSTSMHVAAASILAKVARDRLMEHLDAEFPGYNLGKHKGYGTAAHREAIQQLGPTPIHRRSFLKTLLRDQG